MSVIVSVSLSVRQSVIVETNVVNRSVCLFVYVCVCVCVCLCVRERAKKQYDVKIARSALQYLAHSMVGTVIDLLRRLPSKFEGAARLVQVLRLMNLRGMADRVTTVMGGRGGGVKEEDIM